MIAFSRMMIFLAASSMLMSCGDSSQRVAVSPDKKICPDWSSDSVSNYANDDFSNYGCAFHNNLYVQLKNPEDYTHGAGKTGMNGTRESALLQNYMNGTSSSAAGGSASSAGSASSR